MSPNRPKAAAWVLLVLACLAGAAWGGTAPDLPRIAVADFKVIGEVGIPQAGQAVAELLLGRFDPEKFRLVERSGLGAILQEHKLTIADIVSNPALLRDKRVQGVQYLVLGSVVKLGDLSISARLVDVATGDIAQTAEVSAQDASGLKSALDELARVLQMTAAQKKAYLAEKAAKADPARAAALKAAIARAQADLDLRQKEFQRAEQLRKAGVATQAELDEARLRLEIAKADVLEARARVDRQEGAAPPIVDFRLAKAAYDRAGATLVQAEAANRRARELYEKKVASRQELDAAAAKAASAKAAAAKVHAELLAAAEGLMVWLPPAKSGLTKAQGEAFGEALRAVQTACDLVQAGLYSADEREMTNLRQKMTAYARAATRLPVRPRS